MKVTTSNAALPQEVTITMTGQEALLLMLMVGGVTGSPGNQLRTVTDRLYRTLADVPELESAVHRLSLGDFMEVTPMANDRGPTDWLDRALGT